MDLAPTSLDFYTSDKNISRFMFKLNDLVQNLTNSEEFVSKKCSRLKHLIEQNETEKNEEIKKSKNEIIKSIDEYETKCKTAIAANNSKKEEFLIEIRPLLEFASKWAKNSKFNSNNNDILNYEYEENNAKLIALEKEIILFMQNYTLIEFNEQSGCLIQLSAIDSKLLSRIDLNKLNKIFTSYCD